MRFEHSASEPGSISAPRSKRIRAQNRSDRKRVLITGGAGFVGTNLADHLVRQGRSVLIYDNLNRPGVEQNLDWLRSTHGKLIDFHQDDVRNARALQAAVLHASEVYHFAAQVAVTTSLNNPVDDFEINGRGTLNLLEAIRQRSNPPPLIFTSTNKVYGDLQDLPLRHTATRHQPANPLIHQFGMSEASPLDFHSPYGCSKGAADQYVLDYARTYRLPAVVFRMSCVYGPHQFGNEDQGWVAHFLIRALHGKPVTIYGDGRQVRDILFVHDLVDAFLKARHHMHELSGQAFNIGGGPENTLSLLELVQAIQAMHNQAPKVNFANWRAADQLYYVSDIRKFSHATGWKPQTTISAGLRQLYQWLMDSTPLSTSARLPNSRKAQLKAAGRARRSTGSHSPHSTKRNGTGTRATADRTGMTGDHNHAE